MNKIDIVSNTASLLANAISVEPDRTAALDALATITSAVTRSKRLTIMNCFKSS